MKGFGLIETIVALGVFSLLISAGVSGFIPALQMGRISREKTAAASLSREGLEAARSLRDQSFANLTSGTFGLGVSSSAWILSGTGDITDRFTRQLHISTAVRDAGGSLVASGGTPDPDTFKVASTVRWNHLPGDPRSLTLETYLTNWRQTTGAAFNGLLIYGDSTSLPVYRTYTRSGNILSVETSLPALTGDPRNLIVKTSPQKTEAIAAIANAAGNLNVYCFNGTGWTLDWSVAVGGSAASRRFDVAYEQTTGKAVVLYTTNTATTNELAFRTKSGSLGCGSANWAAAANFNPLRTSGIIHWVKLSADKRAGSNIIAALWADANSDLSAAIWNQTVFTNEPAAATETSLEVASSSQDVEDFDLVYESLSGDLMVVWANSAGNNGTNGVRYRTCNGGIVACTWGAVTTPPTWRDDATNLDISANPVTDEIAFASIGDAGSDLQTGYWSGSAWTNRANVDTSAGTPLAGTKLVANCWLTAAGTSTFITVYMDSSGNGISWYTSNGSGNPVRQTDFATTPAIGNPKKWIIMYPDPMSVDRLIIALSDVNSDLFVKHLQMTGASSFSWSDIEGGSALETTLGQNIVSPFGFSYFQQ